MGINNSRLHGGGEEVLPTRIYHRLEELRKRKSGEEDTFSKNQSMNDEGSMYDGKSQSSDENQSDDNKGSLNYNQQATHVEKLSQVVPLPVFEPRTEEQCSDLHNEEKGKDVEKKGEVVELKTNKVQSAKLQLENKHEEANAKHSSDDDKDEDDEEEEDDIERLIGPSSPSFKIYCIEVDNENQEVLHDSKARGDENQTVVPLQKSPSANIIGESSASASGNIGNPNEIVEIKSSSKRKGNKRKKFRAMKKNLPHVKHLHINRMNPMLACTGSDRRRLFTET